MLEFIFTTLICAWESIVYCFYNVPYFNYVIYLLALIIVLKIYTKMFRTKKKTGTKPIIQKEVSRQEKLLEIWDELDEIEREDYKTDMTDDEWLDFKYELVKRQKANKS